ncbi:putative Disease resistance protein [Heracleum sosnowskyi]|uniref:Disease resistance protein n=1 Tax=Heracleum sosnowskyi TaxID=360622 RepID=A0AAD8IS95_9APIA|nr:putative Disease resistance protein [Heracleum sosnowskyi]
MDLSSIGLSNIPVVIESLLELRYIALCIKAYDQYDPVGFRDSSNTPISICRLKHLETLILDNENMDYTYLPQGVFALNRLRHLIIKGAFSITYLPDNLQTLSYLQTLSLPYLFGCMKILEITPNLRKLSINDCLYQSFIKLTIHNLSKLQHLESLTLQNNLRSVVSGSDNLRYRELSSPNMFPVTLKKLTLGCTFLKWDEMEKIGMLPNLEVLKLQYEAFRGEHWETNDGGFRRLKHLSFKFMRIVQWSAYSDQFPNLQHLKLDECKQLEEIPFDIGDIYTLEMIEIRNCHPAVVQIALFSRSSFFPQAWCDLASWRRNARFLELIVVKISDADLSHLELREILLCVFSVVRFIKPGSEKYEKESGYKQVNICSDLASWRRYSLTCVKEISSFAMM